VKASSAVDSLFAVTSSCFFIYIYLEFILQVALEARDITKEYVSSRSSLPMASALTQFASDGSLYRDSRRSKPSDEVQEGLDFPWNFSADAPHCLSFYK